MTKINDGGPAFPVSKDVVYPQLNGMSIRDWFAGQALAGMLAYHGSYGDGNAPFNNVARAYEHADTMLAFREAKS